MARAAGKKQAPAKIEEDDDTEGWEEAVVDPEDAKADLRLRDWRDVERYREMKELRRLVDDDYGLEEIFHIPLKPRPEPAIPARVAARGAPAKVAPLKSPPPKSAPAKAAAPGKPAAKAQPTNSHARPVAPAPAAKKKPEPPKKHAAASARPRGAAIRAKAKRR